MILTSECMVCTQRIALEAAQLVTGDEPTLKTVISKMMEVLKDAVRDGLDSFLVGLRMMEIIEEVTGCGDPYKDFKRRSTYIAERLAPIVRQKVEESPKPLREACRVAVMGNLMDVIADNGPESVDIRNIPRDIIGDRFF